ncbi:MAG TPA: sigma-70 family RNA polymerase sigma factor [Longimicrobium sp.]|nr:sigma-70 family RNA polymerase sigma factor [Longimicrobium sp.]
MTFPLSGTLETWLGGTPLFAQVIGRGARRLAPAARPEPAPDADAALVRRMAGGDERALAALYDRWQGTVFALAVHVLGDADEAEEVVEETFWQAWRQSARYAGERGAVGSWLTIIARSRALDRLRARTRLRNAHESSALADPLAHDEGSFTDPLRELELDEARVAVRRALDAIPPEQRRTLEMAYFRGMSQSEIADATGEPLGTVKTRTRLGLQRLRRLLEPAVV